jgi:hypothetical protein
MTSPEATFTALAEAQAAMFNAWQEERARIIYLIQSHHIEYGIDGVEILLAKIKAATR